jgi:hypothetical protein
MYRIPKDLDLSPAIGQFTTQIRVGQFDVQFSPGDVHFSVTSQINLVRGGELIGHWEEGKWPDAAFYDVMNTEVTRCEPVTDRLIVIAFANGLEMHLSDDSDQFECMQIRFKDDPSPGII